MKFLIGLLILGKFLAATVILCVAAFQINQIFGWLTVTVGILFHSSLVWRTFYAEEDK